MTDRQPSTVPTDWARRLAPATSPEQRERLLASLSPAMRKAVEAWAKR